MNKTIDKKMFIKFLLLVLLVYTILFPADKINIKEILLVIVLFFGYFGRKIKMSSFIIFFGIIYPLLTIIYSIFRGVELSQALSYGYVWLFLLLVPIIQYSKCNYLKIFLFSTYIIALVIDIIMIMDLFNIIALYDNPLSVFFQNMNELQGLGKGILATFGYSIFYKSCPLILVSYSFYIYKKKFIKAFPLLVALFACGTRANFLIALLISTIIPLICFENKKNKMVLIVLIVISLLNFVPSISNMMSTLNSLKYDRSEAIKISDTNISLEIVNDNSCNFLFGTGVGSSFYSSRGQMMQTYEFSFIDYLRQTGVIGISVLIIFLGLLIKKIINKKELWLLIALLCYLGVAFTNPLLVTSTSFMVYLFVICYNEVDYNNQLNKELI